MRTSSFSGLLLALAALGFAQEGPRGMTPRDSLGLADIGELQLAPDGSFVVFTVSRADVERTLAWLDRFLKPADR